MDRCNLVYETIKKNPAIRFNSLMRATKLKNGTLSYYVSKLLVQNKIDVHRTSSSTHLAVTSIPSDELKICRILTRKTHMQIILLLLKNDTLTFSELRRLLKKSPATISVCVNQLFNQKIIEKSYDIPSNKVSLRNREQVKSVVKEYFPTHMESIINNTIEIL